MTKPSRISDADIRTSAIYDLKGRNEDSIEKLKNFHFKVLTEDNLRTSSFRYHYARISLLVICTEVGDDNTIRNLAMFHKQKVQYDISNPVIKEDVPLKPNPATKEQRFGKAVKDKKAGQFRV